MSASDKSLSPFQFLKVTLLGTLAVVLLLAGINVSIDLYGLFRDVKGVKIPVYNSERTSKYLLSQRYIPANFNTVLLGTSLSDNLDVVAMSKEGKFKVYNASIMGANISELKPIAMNCINGGIKNLVICVSPYLVMSTGGKEAEFGKKTYYGALGSVDLYQTYAVGLIRHFEIMPNKFPKNQINYAGVNDYGHAFQMADVKGKIRLQADLARDKGLPLEASALSELKSFFEYLNDAHINYICYFHPLPIEFLQSIEKSQFSFQEVVRGYVNDESRIIDFNSRQYEYFTTDYTNYIDHGHLSHQGQQTLVQLIRHKMDETFPK